RGSGDCFSPPLIPPQRLVSRPPLPLEAVCADTRRAAPEIEESQAVSYRPFHERPVKQHVGRDRVVGRQGRCPSHLDLLTPSNRDATGHWMAPVAPAAEPDAIGKSVGHGAEQLLRLRRGPQITHVSSENGEKGLNLLKAKPHLDTFLLGPLDLAPQFRAEL